MDSCKIEFKTEKGRNKMCGDENVQIEGGDNTEEKSSNRDDVGEKSGRSLPIFLWTD